MATWPPDTPAKLEIETRKPLGEASLKRMVYWIPFDSGFRGSGLKVGDLIIGHDGVRYTPEHVSQRARAGETGMDRWLEETGFHAGDSFSLLVEREDETLEITGSLDGYRPSYRNDEGKRILGEGGPVVHEKDGFEYAWTTWYNQFVDLATTILPGWEYTASYNTARLRERLEPFADRVAYLEEHYPSALARAVREDFDAMHVMLAGERRELTPADIEYRTLGEKRAKAVTEAADRAFEAFLAEVKGELLEDPPTSPNPFTEDTRELVGKLVRLPELGQRDILFETRRSWYWSGRSDSGYLVDRHADAIMPLHAARDEYIEKVDPFFRHSRVTLIGTIQSEPALVSDPTRNITVTGLRVVPLAAWVVSANDRDARYFVDLREPEREGREAFAGEAELDQGIARRTLSDDLPPEEVLLIAFESLKNGDMDTWIACHASWMVRRFYQGSDFYEYVDQIWDVMSTVEAPGIWDRARKRLLDDVYGIEIDKVGPVETVFKIEDQPAGAAKTAPEPRRVDAVHIRINHIGKVDEEYRTFAGFMLHRNWELQRLDDGPWRLTVSYGI